MSESERWNQWAERTAAENRETEDVRSERDRGMATTTGDDVIQAIWIDGVVMESMHAIRAAINDWERVGAAEDVDPDDMADVERRFGQAMSEFNLAMQVFNEGQRKAS